MVQVPLGVDLATFSPGRRDADLRAALARSGEALLVHCGRLSPEKHPERSIDTVAALHRAGHRVRLVVAGDGPRRPALERRAAGLPVTFLGFVPDRARLARLLASADVSLAPGPHETFGLSALEALASGTPVVVSASSALPEIVGGSGAAALDSPTAFAEGVTTLLAAEEGARRASARAPRRAVRLARVGGPDAGDPARELSDRPARGGVVRDGGSAACRPPWCADRRGVPTAVVCRPGVGWRRDVAAADPGREHESGAAPVRGRRP